MIVKRGVLGTKFAWPGVYFRTSFTGKTLNLDLNDPANIFNLTIDNQPPIRIVRPNGSPLTYKLKTDGPHTVRLEKITESQSGHGAFGGFFVKGKHIPSGVKPRMIEFIGDSFTVGYGNTSPKRECTTEEVWATTDTSHAFGPLTAKHYNADYQINAFSGRGVVRNYDGFAGDTLPGLYPYALFDGKTVSPGKGWWQPQIIVIGLG
ncbi:MAG: hypothetical protein B7Z26_07105, partial [Asticcacaulis sp. 32-58-5]